MREPKELSVEELEAEVRYHNWKYWVENAPVISDYEFDRLVEELKARKPDSPVLEAVGPEGAGELYDDLGLGEKVEHTRPMLSLDKCYSEEELFKWWDKFTGEAVASPKVDGVAAAIRYDAGGRLELGVTRGNGRVGDAITQNIVQVGGVPEAVEMGPVEVRGEVYMPLSIFHGRFADAFANPRNLTAGGLKQKEPGKTGEYELQFLAYDIDVPPSRRSETEVAKRELMVALGFVAVEQVLATRQTAGAIYDDFLTRRGELDYETDGVVFKANQISEHERLGSTAHHPRYAIAYKYQGESGVSTLRDVEWSVSRTGAINPVALVDAIELSGVTVTRASLHNLAIMAKLGGERGLRLGSRVLMMRRGGVIPHVEQVVEGGDEPIEIPAACPSCGGPTLRREDILFAEHQASCSATRLGQLSHFVRVIDAKGFGPKLLSQLISVGLVEEPADLYRLTVDDLLPLERVGRKLAEKLVAELAERLELALDAFLTALGIDELGPVVARLLGEHFGTLEAIRQADVEELAAVYGVGPVIAENVVTGLVERRDMIDQLLERVTLKAPETPSEPVSGSLAGSRILFTGELESMKRKDAQALVVSHGGEAARSVTRDLTHLVLGDADLERFRRGWRSSKLKKVEALVEKGAAIEIIGETEFLEMVGRGE